MLPFGMFFTHSIPYRIHIMQQINIVNLDAKPATKADLRSMYRAFGTVVERNSKIDASVFNLDPTACVTGSKLVDVAGSVCSGCYAIKAYKQYPSVRESQGGNLQLWKQHSATDAGLEGWVSSMVWQIQDISDRKAKAGKAGAGHHRWFAAGDMADPLMVVAIIDVALRMPHIKFWLVTREAAMVRSYIGWMPSNLVCRVSSTMIDQAPRSGFENTCTVHDSEEAHGFICPAMATGGACAGCTACWDSGIANISYKFH
jgi:hypothetical protein